MKLPAVTRKQQDTEDARQTHEGIWYAHLSGKPFLLPGNPEPVKSRRAAHLQGVLHHFWKARGFRMSVKLQADRRLAITLTVCEPRQRRDTRPWKAVA